MNNLFDIVRAVLLLVVTVSWVLYIVYAWRSSIFSKRVKIALVVIKVLLLAIVFLDRANGGFNLGTSLFIVVAMTSCGVSEWVLNSKCSREKELSKTYKSIVSDDKEENKK